jgi:hypothetical protein
MINKSMEQTSPTPKNLQRAFEHAVRDIYEVGLSGKISQYRTPIAQRLGVKAPSSPANAEKQALADAAKALAQLWKISPHLTR